MNIPTTLLRLPDVLRVTGLSRSALYRLEAGGLFPSRRRVTKRTSAWRSDDIQQWIDARPIARPLAPQENAA